MGAVLQTHRNLGSGSEHRVCYDGVPGWSQHYGSHTHYPYGHYANLPQLTWLAPHSAVSGNMICPHGGSSGPLSAPMPPNHNLASNHTSELGNRDFQNQGCGHAQQMQLVLVPTWVPAASVRSGRVKSQAAEEAVQDDHEEQANATNPSSKRRRVDAPQDDHDHECETEKTAQRAPGLAEPSGERNPAEEASNLRDATQVNQPAVD